MVARALRLTRVCQNLELNIVSIFIVSKSMPELPFQARMAPCDALPCECASMLCARGAGPRVVGAAALARRPGFGATTLADARVRCDLFGAKMLLVCMRGLRSRAHEPRMIHGAPAQLCAAQLEDASRPDSFYEEKAPAHGGGGGGGGGSGEAKEGEAPKCARARACGRAATLYGRCVWRSLSARLVPTHLIGVCFALPRTTLSARCGARAPVAPAAIAACCGIGPCQYCIVFAATFCASHPRAYAARRYVQVSMDTRLDYRWIDLRTPANQACALA